jgi:hypothetical protein
MIYLLDVSVAGILFIPNFVPPITMRWQKGSKGLGFRV